MCYTPQDNRFEFARVHYNSAITPSLRRIEREIVNKPGRANLEVNFSRARKRKSTNECLFIEREWRMSRESYVSCDFGN